jgi:hypothetical protein
MDDVNKRGPSIDLQHDINFKDPRMKELSGYLYISE